MTVISTNENPDKTDVIIDRILIDLKEAYPGQVYVSVILEEEFGYKELEVYSIIDKLKFESLAELMDEAGDRMRITPFGQMVSKSGGWLKYLGLKSEEKNPPITESLISRVANEKESIRNPIVFISYSWDDEQHKEWVLNLANRLRSDGIDAILDRYYLKPGKNLTHFVENSIAKAERIVIVFTTNYKLKADKRTGGVGYEYSIMNADLYNRQTTNDKIIPMLRNGTKENSIPAFMQQFIHIDIRDNENFENCYTDLLREIYNEPAIQKPKLGVKPTFNKKTEDIEKPQIGTKPNFERVSIDTSNLRSKQIDTIAELVEHLHKNTQNVFSYKTEHGLNAIVASLLDISIMKQFDNPEANFYFLMVETPEEKNPIKWDFYYQFYTNPYLPKPIVEKLKPFNIWNWKTKKYGKIKNSEFVLMGGKIIGDDTACGFVENTPIQTCTGLKQSVIELRDAIDNWLKQNGIDDLNITTSHFHA